MQQQLRGFVYSYAGIHCCFAAADGAKDAAADTAGGAARITVNAMTRERYPQFSFSIRLKESLLLQWPGGL